MLIQSGEALKLDENYYIVANLGPDLERYTLYLDPLEMNLTTTCRLKKCELGSNIAVIYLKV